MVTKDDLLARSQAGRIKTVSVEGLGELRIRRLGLDARIAIGNRSRAGEKITPAEYIATCLVQDDDSPMFTIDEAQAFCDGDGQLAEKVANEVFIAIGLVAAETAAKN